MNPIDFMRSPEGYVALNEGLGLALRELGKDLDNPAAGSTELSYTVSIVHIPTGTRCTIVQPTVFGTEPGNTNNSNYLRFLSAQQRMMSERLPISSRHIIRTGQSLESESGHIGSAVTALDVDGNYMLVVGCAGPPELLCETYAELIAICIKRRIVLALMVLLPV